MTLADLRLRDPKAAYCIERTLPLEGGLVDAKNDPGGITCYGVSLRYALAEIEAHPEMVRMFDLDHDGDVDRKDIAGLTQDAAATIFFECWWLCGWYANLTPDLVAWKAFDIAVNTGPRRSALILQKALAAVGQEVAIDGVVGPRTVLAVKAETERNGGAHLLSTMRLCQATFYRGLAAKEPKLQRFLAGWLNRAAA